MYDFVYDSTLVSFDDDDAITAPENPTAAPPRESNVVDTMIGSIPAAVLVLARETALRTKLAAEAEERVIGVEFSV